MNELDILIKQLMQEKGGTKQQYLHLLNSITHHETGGTNSPTQKQVGGGPGRGKYQFEIGRNKGGITAAKRTKRYYDSLGKEIPQWLKDASAGKDLDVSNLTSEQQDILFLGNMRQHPRADFSKVMSGEQSVPEFWADNHWAGPRRHRQSRLKNFNETYTPYKKNSSQLNVPNKLHNIHIQEKDGVIVDKPIFKKPTHILSKQEFALGGNLRQSLYEDKELNTFNVGGLHETNSNGGIPMGNNATVEEGETSYNLKNGKYIFSNRITSDGNFTN